MNERKLFQSITKKEKIKNEKVQVNFEKIYKTFKFKSTNGITLIALVISIIVMLILAGVSLNATIGDNGIITQAQNAKYIQSVSVLEEYLQQYYIENYERFENAENKAVALKNYSKSANWFFQGAPLGYVVDKDGNSHYFINVNGLPEDIKKSITGGNANGKDNLTYSDYANMKDVYGVTSNLKVYYCDNGKNSIKGINIAELDVADSTKEIFAAGSSMAKLIRGNSEQNLTLEDLKNIKTLTIDGNSEIKDLKDLYALVSLQEFTLDSVTMNSLEGIENVSQLSYVCIKNSKINDYSGLCGIKDNLKKLYLIKTTDNEIEKMCDAMSKADFSKLTYLGIYDSTSSVTNISDLDKLTLTTKEAVKYLYLYNNYISSVESLKDFKNILILKMYINKITSLKGIENMKSLTELYVYNCDLGKDEIYDTGVEELGKDSSKDSLNAIKELYTLKYLDLSNNYNLVWIDYLGNLNKLTQLKLNSDNKIAKESFVNVKDLILRLDHMCSYPSSYSKLLDSSERQDMINEGLNNSSTEWIALYNNKDIKQLRLDNNTGISDTGTYSIQNVLKTCSSIEVLSLENISISSIDFVKDMPNLKELDIIGTNVTDLSPLKNCTNLKTLVFDKAGTDLTSIQDIISNMNIGLTRVKGSFFRDEISGIVGLNKNALKSLEECSNITNLNVVARGMYGTLSTSNLDLSKCTALTTVVLDSTKMNFKLPKSLKNLLVSWRASDNKFDLSNCENVEKVQFYEGSQEALKYFASHLGSVKINTLSLIRYQSFEGLVNISPNCTVENVYSSMNGIMQNSAVINYADNLANIPGIEKIGISEHGNFKGFSSNVSFPNLKTLIIQSSNVIDNLEFLANSPLLQSINVSNGKISSFKGITNLSKLTSITISNNAISSVYEIENLNNIVSLNLENNCIYDTTTYINSSGEKVTVKNLDILANLNKNGNLRSLFLNENNGIVDWSALSSIKNWKNKSGW